MKPKPTRTTNPLPFEHLEPKRFEDLVRQLAYEFKPWRQLEATGRSGSDDGFDARGWEIVGDATEPLDGSAQEEELHLEVADRLWLIQCKREKSIGPNKMADHLSALPAVSVEGLYGLVFVAACDLSKATRDVCRNWCREKGVQEVHIWGRSEIEDLLYQPKNDHLLFAYFGISLQIRRRSAGAALRRTTTLKRKLKRLLASGGWPGTAFLARDPADARYPYTNGQPLTEGGYLWRMASARALGPLGLRVITRCFPAYYSFETGEWDVASAINRANPRDEIWGKPDEQVDQAMSHALWSLPANNQGHLVVTADLPYELILEIDDVGDDLCELPTVFVTFQEGALPLAKTGDVYFQMNGGWSGRISPDHLRRVRLFPDHFRDSLWETRWASGTGGSLPASLYEVKRDDGTIWHHEAAD